MTDFFNTSIILLNFTWLFLLNTGKDFLKTEKGNQRNEST